MTGRWAGWQTFVSSKSLWRGTAVYLNSTSLPPLLNRPATAGKTILCTPCFTFLAKTSRCLISRCCRNSRMKHSQSECFLAGFSASPRFAQTPLWCSSSQTLWRLLREWGDIRRYHNDRSWSCGIRSVTMQSERSMGVRRSSVNLAQPRSHYWHPLAFPQSTLSQSSHTDPGAVRSAFI